MRARIPYVIVGDVGFYQRAEIKDALASCALPRRRTIANRTRPSAASSTSRAAATAPKPWRSLEAEAVVPQCLPSSRPRHRRPAPESRAAGLNSPMQSAGSAPTHSHTLADLTLASSRCDRLSRHVAREQGRDDRRPA